MWFLCEWDTHSLEHVALVNTTGINGHELAQGGERKACRLCLVRVQLGGGVYVCVHRMNPLMGIGLWLDMRRRHSNFDFDFDFDFMPRASVPLHAHTHTTGRPTYQVPIPKPGSFPIPSVRIQQAMEQDLVWSDRSIPSPTSKRQISPRKTLREGERRREGAREKRSR